MRKISIKFLTKVLLGLLLAGQVCSSSSLVIQEKASTHLRWNLLVPKNQVLIQRDGRKVALKSLNTELITTIEKELKALNLERDYIESISEIKVNKENNVRSLEITTAGNHIELFSFYRNGDNKYVLDYWKDAKDDAPVKSTSVVNPVVVSEDKEEKKAVLSLDKKKKSPPAETKKTAHAPKEFRDFRYGASILWDYEPLAPDLRERVNLSRKTAEFFYPISDRSFKDDEKEVHIQLAINLYRKKKWGLMYKALSLFKDKYGKDTHNEISEYLKANALIRERFEQGHTDPSKEGINIYESLLSISKNYELRSALFKYLFDFYLKSGNYIFALKKAKEFYVASRENFDYEELKEQAKNILHILAKLNQVDKLQKVLKDKMIIKFVPNQKRLAYEIYTLLKVGKTQEVKKLYEKKKSSFGGSIEGPILYNVGEAYFRDSQYKKAIALFDQFISEYSFFKEAGKARLRIALSYDLLDRNPKQVKELYKSAIDRAPLGDTSYEARLRYVGFTSLRKIRPTKQEREERVFLENEGKVKLTKNLNQLLWLVRMRLLILDKEFKKALSYLTAIPVKTMQPLHQRIFEGDGAEVIYGILKQFYTQSDYSYVVKVWEQYKDKYILKVAQDPYINYIIGMSYLNLHLFDSFERELANFEKLYKSPVRKFPIWLERESSFNPKVFIEELNLTKNIKLKNFSLALENIKNLEKVKEYIKLDYWKGHVAFHKKDYKNAIKHFEKFLTGHTVKAGLNVMEITDLLKAYTDSVYHLDQLDKFYDISHAVLNDTKFVGLNNNYMNSVKERIRYLQIEILLERGRDKDFLTLETMTKEFFKKHPKSVHKERVEYVLGLSLIKNKQEVKGEEIFNALLANDLTSGHIKAMVRSELALMKIKKMEI